MYEKNFVGSVTNMNISIDENLARNAVGIVIVGLTLSANNPISGMPKSPKMTEIIITLV